MNSSLNRSFTTIRGLAAAAAALVAGVACAQSSVTMSLIPSVPHAEAGQPLDVTVRMAVQGLSGPSLIGAQFVVRFDPNLLEPVGGAAAVQSMPGPFSLNPGCVVDAVNGTACFFVLDPTFEGVGNGVGDIARIRLRVKPGAEHCGYADMVRFGNAGGQVTGISVIAEEPTLTLVGLPAVSLDKTAPELLGIPAAPISVPADAGRLGAVIAKPQVVATDACDPDVPVVISTALASGSIAQVWPEVFPIGTSTVTWSATDDTGHTRSLSQTITVANHQLLDARVNLLGILDPEGLGFEVPVRVKAGASTQIAVLAVDPISRGGLLAGLQVPASASLPCVSAKDSRHSLTDSASPSIVGTRYFAEFNLVLGDSNDDDLVDVVDFTYLVFDRGPAAADKRSNFNGDGFVNNADFSYIATNFFRSGESCGSLTTGMPRSRVSVKELRRMGHGELEVADFNRDGFVDQRDMQGFLSGGQGMRESSAASGSPIR